MILNNAPQNEAVLSNVGEIGEFRIRNSAKAFNILSSGLYANKIKAIIRELSCNAVDSHTAAGNDAPFEVHLPNALDPYFSIRDFGTGLSHEQVTNIYTTYFESTKTNSNEFIGALGLGSKSPFSYTDNFTVTAIKDGRKGIYSAFINGEGVPSIALMMEEETTEPAGVEVKFSVNDRYDYYKFKEEAESVYRYFKQTPTISGGECNIRERQYDTRDLIPGVHVLADANRGRVRSMAIMGNIAYPIEVPNAETALGDYYHMINCGLEIEFAIGEVDFQASREGLSYIPQTITAIKNKLIAVSKVLADRIKVDADALPNLWDRACFLYKKREHALWATAVTEYLTHNPLSTVEHGKDRWTFLKTFNIEVDALKALNINIRAFDRSKHSSTCTTLKSTHIHAYDQNNNRVTSHVWQFAVNPDSHFVVTDTKTGAFERTKYHYRETSMDVYSRTVYVIEPIDRNQNMNLNDFYKLIENPPVDRRFVASALKEKPRKDTSIGRNVSLLRLTTRRRGYQDQVVWEDAGSTAEYSDTENHYYMPLSGYSPITDKFDSVKDLHEWLSSSGIKALKNVKVFGVRKADIEEVKKKTNWVNIETHIENTLAVPDHNLIMNIVVQEMGPSIRNSGDIANLVSPDSPFKKVNDYFKDYEKVHFSDYAMRQIFNKYGTKLNFNLTEEVKKFVDEISAVNERYPLLQCLNGHQGSAAVAEYINMIDSKGE